MKKVLALQKLTPKGGTINGGAGRSTFSIICTILCKPE
jgi:hypothetical protein